MPNPRQAKFASTKAWNAVNAASFVVGTKAVNTINVAVQLKDPQLKNVGGPVKVMTYLSANADGSTLTPTSVTTATAIGTNGVIVGADSNGKTVEVISNALGQFDLNITQTAGGTIYYLVVVMPDGSVVVSPAITF